MSTYLSPGVYVEEVPAGAVPIQGVSTSTLGMVGPTERGPAVGAELCTSFADFERIYGGPLSLDATYFPAAVRGFFDNGGQLLYCARVAGAGATPGALKLATGGGAAPAPAPAPPGDGGDAPAPAPAAGAASELVMEASGPGVWGNNIWVRVEPGSNPNAGGFRVTLIYFKQPPAVFVDPFDLTQLTNNDRREPDLVEDYDNLTFDPTAPNDVRSTINGSSALVTVQWSAAPANLANVGWTQMAGGTDAAPTGPDYVGDMTKPSDQRSGLAALEGIDQIAILAVPDQTHPTLKAADQGLVVEAMVSQCGRLRSRFSILAVPGGQANVTNIITALPTASSFAATYYPYIQIYDELTGLGEYIPCVGHVAGIYARTDEQLGVEHAPANAEVLGMLEVNTTPTQGPLQFPVTKGDQDILNPAGVCAIRDFRSSQLGVRVWGARTLSADPQWRYIQVRRVFIYLEQSIQRGTQWVVFENNVESTWARVIRSVSNFLESFWRDGGLAGTTPQEAFFVRCDRTTMTQGDIDSGRLICLVGVAPVKPAEFVIFRFSQLTINATT
jgi:Bacteriophage tail sheath protein